MLRTLCRLSTREVLNLKISFRSQSRCGGWPLEMEDLKTLKTIVQDKITCRTRVDPGLVEFLHNPPYIPMTNVPRVPTTANIPEIHEYQHPKPIAKWSEQESALNELAKKAKRLLIISIPNDIFQALDSCEISKDLWLELKKQLEGGAKNLKNNRALCINEYFSFKALPSESIQSTNNRYNFLTNKCKRYGINRTSEENIVSQENRILKLMAPVGGPLALVGNATKVQNKGKKEKMTEDVQKKKKKKKVAYKGRDKRDDRGRGYGELRKFVREEHGEHRQDERGGDERRGGKKMDDRECRSNANKGKPVREATFFKKKAEYYTQRSLMAEQEYLLTDESSDEGDNNALFCGMTKVNTSDGDSEVSTSDSSSNDFEKKLFELQNNFLSCKNTCLELEKKLAFFKRESRLLTQEKDKLYLEKKSLVSEHISEKNVLKEKIGLFRFGHPETQTQMDFVCMMIPEKELSSEAPEFVPTSMEEKLFKRFLENYLRKIYENHFLNHPDITSEVHEIFQQDLLKCLSVPEVVPCTLKNINISKDTNDRQGNTCLENYASIHRDFLDSDSESESESSSVDEETSSVEQ
ncbi:hypothetical protein L6452_09259 [Arctium lappa]|uniref:Uncharacterized protein n=1 Tax=Arctium lappa TaxID=4217 RepID=A0ACB9DK12_ARCLA|nr:hypothetical protein L6452_09259 [Arctium lappa]